MTTAARIHDSGSAHWYTRDGIPCFTVPKAKGDGERPTTLADARKMDLLPSVTSICKILDRPQLNSWLQEQAVLACLTTPRLPNEPDDAYVHRVLSVERQQDQERDVAADFGTRVHDAIDKALNNEPWDQSLKVYVEPAVDAVMSDSERVVSTEEVVVGQGYAGRVDCTTEGADNWLTVWDFKTCNAIPKSQYPEQRMQLGAYAKVVNIQGSVISTANIYISKSNPGEIKVIKDTEWNDAFVNGFQPLMEIWRWLKGYRP